MPGEASLGAEVERLVQRYRAEVGYYVVEHTVQLTSFGGSGTTALGEHLMAAGVDLPTSPGQWPFKHGRTPPAATDVPAGYRVLYLLGDPRDAVCSVFRRHLQLGHYGGLWDREPDDDARARLADLDAFLAAGIDDFGLTDHVERWWDHPTGYPVLFVRLDRIEEAWPAVEELVDHPGGLPPFRLADRSSDWRSLAPDHRRAIDELYGPLAARIASLPPAVLR